MATKKLKLNFKPKLVLDFSPARCYMRERTHSYLWLREEFGEGVFLTLESGQVDLARASLVDGKYYIRLAGELEELVPIAYDFKQALEKYWESPLTKSPEAEAELATLLGRAPRKAVMATAKPKKVSVVKPVSGSPQVAGYTLTELCGELKLDPSDARKAIRDKVKKPGSRWEWVSKDCPEVLEVRAILKGLK